MIGLRASAEAYFTFIAFVILAANVGSSLGLLIGSSVPKFSQLIQTAGILAPNSGIAIALVPVTVIPFMIFSGFILNTENVPVYFIWVEYISFIKYAFQGVATNEVSFVV